MFRLEFQIWDREREREGEMFHEACGASASPNLRSRTAASVQGSAKRRAPDLVNFVPVVACHFYLALTAAFTQPGDHLLAKRCTSI